MLTTDFTGTYDYEREEALHAARFILDDLADGYLTVSGLPERLMKERQHWKKVLDSEESFNDWDRHFLAEIGKGVAWNDERREWVHVSTIAD